MKVFISWSGERSKLLAEALRDMLPHLINAVEPWLSASDIEAGSRWGSDIARKLEETSFGILCLTPENLNEPWILFEAGAISKAVEKSRVVPYLLDLKSSDIEDPLGQFQHIEADKDGTWSLVEALHKAVKDAKEVALPKDSTKESFEVWWPKLSDQISEIPIPEDQPSIERPQEELIEEILSIVRGLVMRGETVPAIAAELSVGRVPRVSLSELHSFEEVIYLTKKKARVEAQITDMQILIPSIEDVEKRKELKLELKNLVIAEQTIGKLLHAANTALGLITLT